MSTKQEYLKQAIKNLRDNPDDPAALFALISLSYKVLQPADGLSYNQVAEAIGQGMGKGMTLGDVERGFKMHRKIVE